ncbi:MAG: hypothetical protein A3B99_05420 [Candidatus Yanofskybacteria bacterium RIFCSPHIGHO2_02_FULL_44_12b]|uniref:UDP-N-acetylmuramyl-tripeptide synthetase n=2 Tax=Candidatus Yanofskyibacteriota TaxID=1752733 RepID=A0A1F8GLD8_9BACT|nr:MAG: UDP-N-acetylmuramoyl-L-alanyl-D-glutamate-2,6-diaminopimelate ligase [Candidatus Yanofskybacteria bacterium GW2011_GWA2_44_9]OGN05146.1 MAG: hypothetical protein A2659_02310 [Candidatus Yanofskybacteria bacterium RIFCSPHIGHO2_01_FULL_44_24]OGN14581.1 MAG: hypothetical protein A3B99_05420 [Candidatus Yanofskybacteria bacterium RIFCSPHIGHO2_02_FULL_44_12b]OGN25476.1 MAG: hypothetical protein A2925_01965 [Candidatus Yanofskybacteria bacterium RIFCSPLOWO2_01_FULL_44_22]
MFREGFIDKILRLIKKLIPKSVFNFLAPAYHAGLAYLGALVYGFPSRSMKVIGVTGTKGKSTVVFLTSKLLEGAGYKVAAVGSLGFKIKDKEWPNNLKMTMPGRFKLQKFLYEAKKVGCEFVVLEVTSEGIKQKRHLGIDFDCAVFTNLHKEHIESHGSFENYKTAKTELFKRTSNIHVLNADDPYVESFSVFLSNHKIFFGLKRGDIVPENIKLSNAGSSFDVYGTSFNTSLSGEFNVYNFLAVLAVGAMYKIDLPTAKPILESIKGIPGRMEFIQREPFSVVVDYAHTPDSLRSVYATLRKGLEFPISNFQFPMKRRLICVLGAAGGGRDKWKRPEFGKIAAEYCDEIILTDEDPYDENPEEILNQILSGFSSQFPISNFQFSKILDRKEAIKKALTLAQDHDIVVITGKGSEMSMAVAGGKKVPWSDRDIVRELLQ